MIKKPVRMNRLFYTRYSIRRYGTIRQLQNGIAVRIGKTFRRCLTIGKPDCIEMFFRRQNHRKFFRHQKPVNMFRIFRHTGCEPVSPDRKNFKDILSFPVLQTIERHFMTFRMRFGRNNPYPRFLEYLAHGRLFKRFRQRITRSGHRLPEPRTIGTFDQQNIQFFRVNHDKNRLRNLVCHIHNKNKGASRSLSFKRQVMPFRSFSDGYAIPAAVFH